MFFSWLDLDYGLLGEKTTEIKCHFHHIISKVCLTINVIYHFWCWPWSPGRGTVWKLLHCKATLFTLFLHRTFGRWAPWAALTYGVWSHVPFLWGWRIYTNYLKFFCMGDLCLLPHLYVYFFTHLFIFVWTDACVFYAFHYNLILLFFIRKSYSPPSNNVGLMYAGPLISRF